MQWWNFNDTAFVVFFVIILILLFVLTAVITSYILVNRAFASYDTKLQQESISTRIFTIDMKNNSVIYFNRSDMKNKKEMDIASFYFHFHQNDTDKVKQWILSIIENPKTADQY